MREMTGTWEGVENLLRSFAEDDLRDVGEIQPTLVAFLGEELLFVAGVRSFARGAYHQPLIELLALAIPMGADRIALSIGGRAWSVEDPIAPVLEGVGDLRQRVLVCSYVDGSDPEAVTVDCVLHPFHVAGAVPVWHEALRPGPPDEQSFIPWAIARVLEAENHADTGTPEDHRRQAIRCETLGHSLWLGELGAVLMAGEEANRAWLG